MVIVKPHTTYKVGKYTRYLGRPSVTEIAETYPCVVPTGVPGYRFKQWADTVHRHRPPTVSRWHSIFDTTSIHSMALHPKQTSLQTGRLETVTTARPCYVEG